MKIVLTLLFLSQMSFAKYKGSSASFATAFAAKEMCSCLFVVGQTKKYCKQYIKNKVFNPPVSVNNKQKKVSSSILGLWRRKAKYMGPKTGCRFY